MPMRVDLTDLSSELGGSRRLTGHLARPDGPGPWPGVVVVHEAFGVDEVMLRQTDRLAEAGYLALMPDLFTQGDARRCLIPTMRASLSGHGRAYADLEAARRTLAAHPDCTGKVGLIGFCMGGAFALVSAGKGGYDAVSANYGMLPKNLDRAGIPHDVKEYPQAGHSFLNDAENAPRLLRPLTRIAGMGPEPESAADAWRRIEAFFAEHLGHG